MSVPACSDDADDVFRPKQHIVAAFMVDLRVSGSAAAYTHIIYFGPHNIIIKYDSLVGASKRKKYFLKIHYSTSRTPHTIPAGSNNNRPI